MLRVFAIVAVALVLAALLLRTLLPWMVLVLVLVAWGLWRWTRR